MIFDFVGLRRHDLVLGEGVLQPLQLFPRLGLRIIEQRLEVLVEHLAAAPVHLGHEGVVEVRQLLVVLVDDRLLHARLLELEAGGQHVVPGLRHRDAVIVEDLLVVDEADDVGVIGQAVELALIGHVAERVVGRAVLVFGDLGEVFLERHQPARRRPRRQPVLASVDDVGLGVTAQTQDHGIVIVGPGVVGDVDLDPGILLLELLDVVLNGLERVVPDHELEGDVLGLCGRRNGQHRTGRGQRADGEELPSRGHWFLGLPARLRTPAAVPCRQRTRRL